MQGFNPRTRDGCEHPLTFHKMRISVSIHAPVMGAKVLVVQTIAILSFNPRTRDGCELDERYYGLQLASVSIHAPVMGANIIINQ